MRLRNWVCCLVGWLLTGLVAFSAAAQQARIATSEAPHYTGVPVDIQVIADGFAESPQPEIKVVPPTQGQLEYSGANPNISTSIQIINGRMSQSKTVQFAFNYRFSSQQAGNYTIGPFTVSQDGRSVQTQSISLQLQDIPVADSKQHIKLVLPAQALYVGQRAEVQIQWWVEEKLRGNLYNQRLQIPLLAMQGEFKFSEASQSEQTNSSLIIDTVSGSAEHPATARYDQFNGEKYIVQTVTLTMMALRAGEYQLQPALLTVDEATRWRRNIFGNRVPTHARKSRIMDEPRTLVVKALPQLNRPASFAGAVGKGFSLEVTADRSVVQVGDPITLSLILQGDASVDSLSLPPLQASGLTSNLFRLPEGDIAGTVSDGKKLFQTTVRVISAAAREIPPLAFSWFDPQAGAYQTSYSEPIALSVRQAQVVSAADVVSATPENNTQDENQQTPQQNSELQTRTPVRPRFTLSGADLAIEKDLQRLRSTNNSWLSSPAIQSSCYVVALLLLLGASWRQRQAARDPVVVAQQQHLKQSHEQVKNANIVADLATALRQMAAIANNLPRSEFDAVLADCDNLAYGPDGSSAPVSSELHTRALALADAILEAKA